MTGISALRQEPHGSLPKLREARPSDRRAAGKLLREAMTPRLSDAVFGLGVAGGAAQYFERLFQRPRHVVGL